MNLEILLRVVAGIVLLAGNAFFVTTEFALTRVRQFDESDFDGHAGLRRAWEMTDELEVYLSGCQVGITVSSVALGVVAEPAITELFAGAFTALGITSGAGHSTVSVVVALAVINLAHVIFGEQIPTYLGVERTRLIAKYLAPLLYAWVTVMGPIIHFADRISKAILGLFGVTITRSWKEDEDEGDEVRTFADTKRELGALLAGTPLSEERKAEIINALDISNLAVEEIMISPEDIRAPTTDQSIEDTLEYIQERPHTRYPLFDADAGAYVGTLYTATVVQNLSELQLGDLTIEEVATDLLVLSPETPVSEVIDQFQMEQQELALISTAGERPIPQSEVLGLVTTTDAFEAIAGDLEDPIDASENV